MRVAVCARTRDEVETVAREIGGLALSADVSKREDVERMVAETERELGPIDLLVNNAGLAGWEEAAWKLEPEEWWHVFEVNVLGTYLCCRAVIPGMIERGRGRIVNTGSGAGYLRGSTSTAYSSSKAAVYRFGETLAAQLEPYGIPVFTISPGLVRTEMTRDRFAEDAPWTPPELAPRLVRALATGRADRLSGRYIHAEHDDLDDLVGRADEIARDDLNAIRLRR
jgi:NAD(P)-dependent dehydrogenase (short-subunit alcohol dehydrogenase family)